MMKRTANIRNQEGFVLITGLLVLLVLTLLGISATTNTSLELQIAGNDRLHKQTFYEAEAGAILASEVLEQNFNCATGFGVDAKSAATATKEPANKNYAEFSSIRVYDQSNGIALWRNSAPANLDTAVANPTPPPATLTNVVGIIPYVDVIYPATAANLASGQNLGYYFIGGSTEMLPGGALQMAAGYEGKGKGSASGGVAKLMDIYSDYRGAMSSRSIILFGWRHVIGSEGACEY